MNKEEDKKETPKEKWRRLNPNYNREYREKNRDKILETERKYKLRNREKVKACQEKWRKANKERVRANLRKNSLKRKYGMSVQEYDDMLASQLHRCAICKKHQSELKTGFVVDHHHETGKVRGLLCRPCNSTIGYAFESISTLRNAIDYLENAACQH